MRISSKGRLALVALCEMALSDDNQLITLANLSQKLGCSKLYLEQVFAVLRRAELVHATKGAGGGYTLAKSIDQLTAYDILAPIELSLFAPTEKTVEQTAAHIETSLQDFVFLPLDKAVEQRLKAVTLADLVEKIGAQQSDMYYI